jgi:hypothetical protein
MPFVLVRPIINHKVRALCSRPYPNHKKGCPNIGKRDLCPPKAKLIGTVLDLRQPMWAIYNSFPFGEHVTKMRGLHPEWSQRQVECCLYWQGAARKQLKAEIKSFLEHHPGLKVLTCPEACGVDITATMLGVGIELEWPPRTVTYQIALAGSKAS